METKEFQRWTARRKVELLLQLIRGEKKLVDVCREHDLKQSEVEGWMDTFVKGGERSRELRLGRGRIAACECRATAKKTFRHRAFALESKLLVEKLQYCPEQDQVR